MNIPIYNAIITDVNEGINKISLVEIPAVESNFIAFAKDRQHLMFSTDDEQQMIKGVLMRADFPIYRNDAQLGEYYIQFSKETVKEMAEKLLLDGKHNWVNIEHLENTDVDGVDMVELFIKDSSKGINPKGFEDISDGSLFATFKIRNKEIWECIKQGVFQGFSLEGYFNYELAEKTEYDEIMDMINKIKNKIGK